MSWLKILFVGVLLNVFLLGSAAAHYLWVVKDGEAYIVARGVPPERLDPYNPMSVKSFIAVDAEGMRVPEAKLERIDMSEQVRFMTSEDVAVVGVSCDWGYRVKTTDGKKLLSRSRAEQAGLSVIEAFFSSQNAKVLFQHAGCVTKPMGMKFELVPLEDLSTVSSDRVLRIQALFDGKPLPETRIFAPKGKKILTDEQGIVQIKLDQQGRQVLRARHKVPVVGDPDKDYHLFTTFLVFDTQYFLSF